MPAPTGHVEWHGSETTGHWRTRVTYSDGTRRWERLDGLGIHEKPRAKKRALIVQVGARTRVPTPGPRARVEEPEGESVEEYGARWLDDRRRQGRADFDGEAGTLRRHLYPHLGARALASITRADLERVVERLDDAVRAAARGVSVTDGGGRGSASPAGTVAGTPPDLARLVGELVAAGQLEAARLVLDGMARARGDVAGVVDLAAVRAARGA